MIVWIEGVNRMENCHPKNKKDMDNKFFFETRHQLYRVFPDQLTRVDIYEYGHYKYSDEMIVYPENSITPQLIRGQRITKDKLMMDMDEFKGLPGGIWQEAPVASLTSKIQKSINKLLPFGGLIVTGIILLYAFLTGGI